MYFGFGWLGQSIFLAIFIPDFLHFDQYDTASVIEGGLILII